MTGFTLSQQAQDMLDKPLDEAISYVQALPAFGYKSAETAFGMLEVLIKHPRVNRMPNLVLFGDTNNGKTEIARAFVRRHQATDDENDDFANIPVVMVQAPPKGEESRLYSAILREIYSPLASVKRLDQLPFEVKRQLANVNTRMLIIDEFHNILNAGMQKQRAFLDAIKWLGNELRIPIVAIGTHDVLNALSTSPQINNRFDRCELQKWDGSSSDFLRLLDSFEQNLPFHRRSFLREADVAREILRQTDSTIGEIGKVVSLSAIRALTARRGFIALEDVTHCGFVSASKRRP